MGIPKKILICLCLDSVHQCKQLTCVVTDKGIGLNQYIVRCDKMAVADDATLSFLPNLFKGSFETRMNLHHTVGVIAD